MSLDFYIVKFVSSSFDDVRDGLAFVSKDNDISEVQEMVSDIDLNQYDIDTDSIKIIGTTSDINTDELNESEEDEVYFI